MRRISLALALLGAVAAAGCGGAGGTNPPASQNKGLPETNFPVTVLGEKAVRVKGTPGRPGTPTLGPDGSLQLDPAGAVTVVIPGGGLVSGPGIKCGEDASGAYGLCTAQIAYQDPSLSVSTTLTATALAPSTAWGWAGACTGTNIPTCNFYVSQTQMIAIRFATSIAGVGAHGPFNAPEIHIPAFLRGDLPCADCHGGPTMVGSGNAPACAACHTSGGHDWPIDPIVNVTVVNVGKHFEASGHNSGTCARCHAGDGFRDLIGADMTPSNVLSVSYGSSAAAATDSTAFNSGMKCDMCHNSATVLGGGTLNQHKFPSGNVVTMDGKTAICSQCHDGGRPGYEVSQLLAQAPNSLSTTVLDSQITPAASNKTVRAHYLPAASTLFATAAGNWYQYAGAVYTAQNQHGGIAGCTDCHNPHSGELPADRDIQAKCGGCHNDELTGQPVTTFAQLEESRQFGFEGDIDGDGTQESLKLEIDGLAAKLLVAMQTYATNIASPGTSICAYNGRLYKYTNTGVACGTTPNNVEYNTYTPRLLRAGYNYFMYQNDTGAWAHNPRYTIEIIYDSIADLNTGLWWANKPTAPNGKRAFNGHFGAADAASPYSAMLYHGGSNAVTGELIPPMGGWSAACGQCHGGAAGLTSYLATMPAALTVATPAVPAMQCNTCHTYNGTDMKGLRSISKVYFPPQKNGGATSGEVSFNGTDLPVTFALCGSCHSARENAKSVDAKNLVSGAFSTTLVNPHYLGAAATVMGTRTKSWYEYPTKTYTAFPAFWKSGTNGRAPGPHGSPHGAECTGCHQGKDSKHSFEVNYTYCNGCHAGPYALAPKEEEYASMKTELLAALNAYVTANLTAFQTANGASATGLCYDGNVYGYVLVKNGTTCTATGAKLDLNSMRAAYNLHWMNKDPGGWAHNEFYVQQLVYDSIKDLGVEPSFVVTASTTDLTLNRP